MLASSLSGVQVWCVPALADEDADPLLGRDQTTDFQSCHGLADHGAAYLECLGELLFAGQPNAGHQVAAKHAFV